MEPFQTHGAASPQQGLTQPAEGCPSGPRPEDLLLGGHEGANPHAGRRVANEAAGSAAGAPQSRRLSASPQGGKTRLRIYECFAEESKKRNSKNGSPEDLTFLELINIVHREIGEHLKPLSNRNQDRLIAVISLFLTKTMKMFRGCKSNKKFFMKKHKIYLGKPFLVDIPDDLKANVNADDTNGSADEAVVEAAMASSVPDITGKSSSSQASTSAQSSSQPASECLGYSRQLRCRKRVKSAFQDEPLHKVKDFVSATGSATGNKRKLSRAAKSRSSLMSPNRALKI